MTIYFLLNKTRKIIRRFNIKHQISDGEFDNRIFHSAKSTQSEEIEKGGKVEKEKGPRS
jgi:hypothetical protein